VGVAMRMCTSYFPLPCRLAQMSLYKMLKQPQQLLSAPSWLEIPIQVPHLHLSDQMLKILLRNVIPILTTHHFLEYLFV
jgi:hypothetical protein